MAETTLYLQGTGYVPGTARGILHRGIGHPGGISLLTQKEAAACRDGPAALIVVDGAPLSHRMIGLVALGLPTVLIDADQARALQPGQQVCVDGAKGLISDCGNSFTAAPRPRPPKPGQAVLLADGTAVRLMASVRGPRDAAEAVDRGAASIGLVRSEFIGHHRLRPPDAAYFKQAFRELGKAAGQLAITLRLVDLAADKPPRWLPDTTRLLGPLGMQGARLYRRDPVRGVVDAQLAAVADLSRHCTVEVLIPFLGNPEELTRWTRFVRDALPSGIRVGAMLETPAAVLDLANWLHTADFVAIGCNDLMQCLFGADRDEPRLRDCLDPNAPVLYRVLNQVRADAGSHVDAVRLCGVLPRLAGVLPVLVGLGFRNFSVDPIWIPYLARNLSRVNLQDAQVLAERVLGCPDSGAVRTLLGGTDGSGVST